MKIQTGILTISDRCSQGIAKDISGPLLRKLVEQRGWVCLEYLIVPDDPEKIKEILFFWVDEKKLPFVLTTGGTGVGPRDVTPEATLPLLEKSLPGISEAMRLEGLKHTPFASLSRGVSGVRGNSLILNLPGSPKGAEQSFEAVIPVIPHLLSTLSGEEYEEVFHEKSGCHATQHPDSHVRLHAHSKISESDLLEVSVALQKMLECVRQIPEEKVRLLDVSGRVLAQSLYAREDLPPFENSSVDGYAVMAADLGSASPETPIELKVQEKITAGSSSLTSLQRGKAVRIMTGAMIPQGADAVVMQEFTVQTENHGVKILRGVKAGENIRGKGEDVKKGDLLLNSGTTLRAYEIALLASQGFVETPVVRTLKASLVATGDELLETSESLSPGKIRNSNTPAMIAALKKSGIEVLDYGIIPDLPEKLQIVFKEALETSDALLISGGVSVGDLDYTREILFKIGVKEIFWKVAVKPGKPFFFGMYQNLKPVFGLPGNPISSLVCLEELVIPVFDKMIGKQECHPRYHLQGKVLNHYDKSPDRLQYLFCAAEYERDGFVLKILEPQGSHRMGMSVKANALAAANQGVSSIQPGDQLFFRWL